MEVYAYCMNKVGKSYTLAIGVEQNFSHLVFLP